jgi:Zn-dependent peptidase ImmA (M78 family)
MPRGVEALINPKLLQWARERAGFDLEAAAAKTQQPAERIESWEKGQSRPTIPQLRKLGQVYKRPIAVFYLPEPPRDFKPLGDFRRLPEGYRSALSPKLLYLIRHSRERQEWARELRTELGEPPLTFVGSAQITDDLPELGKRIRGILSVSADEQQSWRDSDEALRSWTNAIERAGVFVFQSTKFDQIQLIEMRGFSLPDPIAPAIVINSKDWAYGKVFTLLHEFAHILLGTEGISNLELADRPGTPDQRMEVFCNALTAETLVPETHIRSKLGSMEIAEINDTAILRLSRHYSVSREVVARRLSELGIVSTEFYRSKREQYLKEFRERKPAAKKDLRIPYSTFVLRDNGRAFSRLALGAYAENLATPGESSNLLNAKMKYFGPIEAEIFPVRRALGGTR